MASRREKIEAMLEDDPTDTFLRYSLAMELDKEGENEHSLEKLSELTKDEPPYVPAFFMAGQQLVRLDRVSEARAILRDGIEQARITKRLACRRRDERVFGIARKFRRVSRLLFLLGPTGRRDCARGAALATALPHCFFRSTAGSAAFGERFGELAELNGCFVLLSQLLGQLFSFVRRLTQEVKEQSGPIEKMFHVHECGWNVMLAQEFRAGFECRVPVLFEPRDEQFVFDGHDPQDLPIGAMRRSSIERFRQDFADFQATPTANNDSRTTRITQRVSRDESADFAQQAVSDQMVSHRHYCDVLRPCCQADGQLLRLAFTTPSLLKKSKTDQRNLTPNGLK